MALDNNKKPFGLDIESRLKPHTVESTFTSFPMTEEIQMPSPTRRKIKEPQKERLQMTIKPSMKAALQQYCDDIDQPMNKVVLDVIYELLNNKGYYK